MTAAPGPLPSLFDVGPFAPCPAPFNMAAHTLAPALRTPVKVALEVLAAPGEVAVRRSHGEIAALVRATAGGLAALGLGRGDRVALRLSNSEDFPTLFFAANAIGAVPVPLSSQLTVPEVAATPPSSSTPPAPPGRRRASCTPSAPPGRGG